MLIQNFMDLGDDTVLSFSPNFERILFLFQYSEVLLILHLNLHTLLLVLLFAFQKTLLLLLPRNR